MSINHEHLRRLVKEMEQGVAATTKYTWLDLAQEVIHLRDALGYLVEETRLAAENSDDAVVQKRVADAIKTTVAKIQGDHDE